ncbi:MAG: formate dehydrogenase, partial [Gemmobacter sp.]
MKVFVPLDAAARALGADAVAEAVAREAATRGRDVTVIRNGSRGMVWLEPLVELEIGGIRHGFGPLAPGDVPALFDTPGTHPKAIGPVEDHPWMKGQ